MASTEFKLIGHVANVFSLLQSRPGEWINTSEAAAALGVPLATLSNAFQSLQRANYAIADYRTVNSESRLMIRSVERPGQPCCTTCGSVLTGGRKRHCLDCLPTKPAEIDSVEASKEMRVRLLSERYAQGVSLWVEQGERY